MLVQKSDRDKLHKEKREEREQARRTAESGLSPGKLKLFRSYQIAIQNSISGNIWTETSYDNWIVADTTENIVYRCYAAEAGEGDSRYKVFRKAERILKCVPISITKHENPFDDDLGISTTYTITFKNTISKTYTLSNVTLDTAADWLKAEGYIMPTSSRGGSLTYTLSAMVDAYREDGKLVTERGAHFEGYYYDQGDIQVSKINLEEKHPRPSLEDCIVCANFLDERAKLNIYKYKDTEINRQADLATYIKWSIVAPFNFVIKQLTGNHLRALSFSGERDGGKTEAALEVLDIHGHRVDNGQLGGQNIYSRKVGDMNTEAKFGECVDKTTYPVLGNEFGKLESYGRGKGDERLLETARNAIESTVCRTGKKGSRYHATFMSAGSLMFTGNAVISSRGEIVKRCHTMKYSGEDRHELTDSNTVAFNDFMKANRHKYKILGDWTIRYILDNKQELLLSKKHDCYQIMNTVIEAFYKNIDRQVPEWLTKWIIDTSLDVDEESIIRAILFEHVNNAVRQNYQLIFSPDEKLHKYGLAISEKVDRCLKNHLLSFVRPIYSRQKTVTDGKVERVVQHYEIDSSIRMLFDQRLPDITLIKIGQKMRFEHGRNGKGNVIKFTPNQLVGFLEGQSVDENAENGDG